jgi:hypothetical protein
MEIDNVNTEVSSVPGPDELAPIAIFKRSLAYVDGDVWLTNLTIPNNTAAPNAVRIQGEVGLPVDGVHGYLTVLNGNENISASQANNITLTVN